MTVRHEGDIYSYYMKNTFLHAREYDIVKVLVNPSNIIPRVAYPALPDDIKKAGHENADLFIDEDRRKIVYPVPRITKNNLVILPVELQRMEEEYAELAEMAKNESIGFKREDADLPTGDLLIGWSAFSEYMKCTPETAKNRLKGQDWMGSTPEGLPSATTDQVKRHMLSGKKKTR